MLLPALRLPAAAEHHREENHPSSLPIPTGHHPYVAMFPTPRTLAKQRRRRPSLGPAPARRRRRRRSPPLLSSSSRGGIPAHLIGVHLAQALAASIAAPPRPRRQGPVVDVLSSAGITTSPLSRWSCLVPPLQGALTIREEIELMRNVYKLLGGLHAFFIFPGPLVAGPLVHTPLQGLHLSSSCLSPAVRKCHPFLSPSPNPSLHNARGHGGAARRHCGGQPAAGGRSARAGAGVAEARLRREQGLSAGEAARARPRARGPSAIETTPPLTLISSAAGIGGFLFPPPFSRALALMSGWL
uniref:Uncharacterized protein n=1 Tax=Oryza nivara TaxID=4536 RepID=A0A0E0HZZ7_ORYNI